MNKKIAILIPTTSKKRNYKDMKDSDLFKYTISSFLKTYDSEHSYTFFIGIDDNDEFYTHKIRGEFIHILGLYKIDCKFIEFKPCEGNVVYIWNQLFNKACLHPIRYDYFHQTGDDINYLDSGWVNQSILELERLNNIGVVGPTDWGRRQQCPEDYLLTQTFVSKEHFNIFGYYFHPYLRNWFCDNWITEIYRHRDLMKQIPQRILNLGGEERYVIDNAEKEWIKCIQRDCYKIPYYIELKNRGI